MNTSGSFSFIRILNVDDSYIQRPIPTLPLFPPPTLPKLTDDAPNCDPKEWGETIVPLGDVKLVLDKIGKEMGVVPSDQDTGFEILANVIVGPIPVSLAYNVFQ